MADLSVNCPDETPPPPPPNLFLAALSAAAGSEAPWPDEVSAVESTNALRCASSPARLFIALAPTRRARASAARGRREGGGEASVTSRRFAPPPTRPEPSPRAADTKPDTERESDGETRRRYLAGPEHK